MTKIHLRIFGQPIRIHCDDARDAPIISSCYSAFRQPTEDAAEFPIELKVARKSTAAEPSVVCGGKNASCRDLAHLIYTVDKTLTLQLQYRRSDLFFLHAAVVSANDRCFVIVGESGAGKSTLCWVLCNSGFCYGSDELSPVDLGTSQVEAYPRALCLKGLTRKMPRLPTQTIDAETTLHIPACAMPSGYDTQPATLDSIVFLLNAENGSGSDLTEIRPSEATARLYANGLNQLAHEHQGLRAASKLARAGRCFTLSRGNLNRMRDAMVERFGA